MKKYLPLARGLCLLLFLPFHIFAAQTGSNPRFKKPAFSATQTDPIGVMSHFLSNPSPFSFEANQDTIKILALRVQFEQDNVATTTGDGLYDLSAQSDYIFDRPPHDRSYFQNQLLALANYFKTVSNGRLVFSYDVLPHEETLAYSLSNDMAYYSGRGDENLQKVGWVELLRDAVLAACDADSVDFADYDVYIVFHAGVGSDVSFDFDPTPYDIQSAFIDFETLKETLGPDDPNFNGIPAGDQVFIKEGIILPETQNQEGYNLALLGTMTLLMGSQLGMPNLFNTETGDPGIGQWGLMDQGSFNFLGLIPAEPDAWTKIFMGWEQPVVVTTGQDLKIGTMNTVSAPHLYKIPITAEEYFLVENRNRDWNDDGIAIGHDASGKKVEFDTTGSVLGEEGLGVITSVDEYDFGLPGSGILIWHIDEKVIRQNLLSNTINNQRDHRGVDLVECDGAQDIGYSYGLFTAGSGTETGDYFDPYWIGNVSHQIVNDTNVVELSPRSIPNSNANNGAKTYIKFYQFSRRDTLMTFSVESELQQPGFPQYTGSLFGPGALKSAEINAAGEKAIVAVSVVGKVFAWKKDGTKLIDNYDQAVVRDVAGNDVIYPLALFAETEDSVFLPLLPVKFADENIFDLIAVDKNGTFYAWSMQDVDGDGRAALRTKLQLGARPSSGPMQLASATGTEGQSKDMFFIGTEDGIVHHLAVNSDGWSIVSQTDYKLGAITGLAAAPGEQGSQLVISTASGSILMNENMASIKNINGHLQVLAWGNNLFDYFNGQKSARVFGFSDAGELATFDRDLNLIAKRVVNDASPLGPILGDPDADGLPELLLSSPEGLYAYEATAVSTLDFPITLRTSPESQTGWSASPLYLKYKNNSTVVIYTGSDGILRTIDNKGNVPQPFPLTTAAEITTTPLIEDIDSDGDLELLALSTDGFLYAWDLDYRLEDVKAGWTQFGGDNNNSFSYYEENPELPEQQKKLIPSKSAFCYPNPTEGNSTNIRYSLSRAVQSMSIRIYDLAGDFVTSLQPSGLIPGDHEVVWDLSEVQSGVYLARLEASDSSDNSTQIIKIAVVK
jgi:M6 family metalloprotease-like protein